MYEAALKMNNRPFSDKVQSNVAISQLTIYRFSSITFIFCLLCFVISSSTLKAQTRIINSAQSIVIFFQPEGHQQTELIEYLQLQLSKDLPNIELTLVDIKQLTKSEIKTYLDTSPLCSVSIGEDTTKKVLSLRSSVKAYAINVSHNQLSKLTRTYKRLNVIVSGIYQEQSFKRQVLLAKALQPGLEKISTLVGQVDKFYLPDFMKVAKESELPLNFKILQRADTAEHFITTIANKNDFVLILNNQQLYTKPKLASLILTATRHQIRLIGNGINSAKIGMLASIYTPTTSLARESSNDIKRFCQMGLEMKPHFAKDFSVSINHKISETLNLKIESNEALKQKIMSLE
jgi:ABC-type uncharacterized transport system substrate-binding protein